MSKEIDNPPVPSGEGEETRRRCKACKLLILPTLSPNCKEGDLSVHKSCEELPPRVHHFYHPQHSLKLQKNVFSSVSCDSCQQICDFSYRCGECNFDLGMLCAFPAEIKIQHEGHEHPLVLLRKPALMFCNACVVEHRGYFYCCLQCSFVIHEDCASLSKTLKHNDHDHPLDLVYSLSIEYRTYFYSCDICKERLNDPGWAYLCQTCHYVAHLNCAAAKTEAFMSIFLPAGNSKKEVLNDVTHDPCPIHLPIVDESVSIVSYLLNLNEDNPTEIQQEIVHHGHDHKLTIWDDSRDDNSNSKRNCQALHSKKCNACIQPVSPPFYSCKQCNFFLHKSCSELPMELQSPCHEEHPLFLLPRWSEFFGIFVCECCQHDSNGYVYHCGTCNLQFDVKCALLPQIMSHDADPGHHLALKVMFHDPYDPRPYEYHCRSCDFKMKASDAFFSSVVRHRLDREHPLKLTYKPIQGRLEIRYCPICEYKVNPNEWFYHCMDCDDSYDPTCFPIFGTCSNILLGRTLQDIHVHHHSLLLVSITKKLVCKICEKLIYGSDSFPELGFECSDCNIIIHFDCARKCVLTHKY